MQFYRVLILRMKVILDDIIFYLQTAGGISNLWNEHEKYLNEVQEFKCEIVRYGESRNIFITNYANLPVINRKLSRYTRYINPKIKRDEKYIFHSSYYRVSKSKNAINV